MNLKSGIVGLTVLGAVVACGGDDDEASESTLAFHAQVNPLGDYSYDSGLQPAGSPVQAQFLFTSTATLDVDAQAVVTDDDEIASQPKSGTVTLAAKFLLQANLHVDVGALQYDGEIPGLDAIDISFGGNTGFDPFAIDAPVLLDTSIPETKLPDIPLPGGLPGHLTLTITTGSVLSSSFRGTCAATDGKTASYRGHSVTQGAVAIQPSIVLEIPLAGPKTFDLPVVTAPIPSLELPMDLGTIDVTDTAPAPAGAEVIERSSCDPIDDAPDGNSSGGNSSGGVIDLDAGGADAGDILACASNDFTYEDLVSNAPRSKTALAGSCTDLELDSFEAALTDTATFEDVQASVSGTCRDCIFTDVPDVDMVPASAAALLYFDGQGGAVNAGWCVGNRTHDSACGQAIAGFQYCGEVACGGCGGYGEDGAPDATKQDCLDAAYDAPYVCNDPIRQQTRDACPGSLDDAVSFCNQLTLPQQIRILCGPS